MRFPRSLSLSVVDRYGLSLARLGRLAGLSFAAGVSQVIVLVILGNLAVAATNDVGAVAVRVGPIDLSSQPSSLILVALISSLCGLALHWRVASETSRLSSETLARFQRALFSAHLDASWALKAKQRDGGLQELMSNHATKSAGAVLWIAQGCSAAFSLLALLVGAVVVQPLATLTAGLFGAVLFLTVRPLLRRSRSYSGRYAAASVDLATSITEGASLSQEAVVFGVNENLEARVGAKVDTSVAAYSRSKFFASLVPELYRSGAFLLLLAALGVALRVGPGQIASLGAVVLLLLRGLGYVQTLQRAAIHIVQLSPFQDELTRELDRMAASTPESGVVRMPGSPSLVLRDAGFSYDGEAVAFSNISVDVDFGETLGIVGPSGAGKSTLFELLLRLRSLDDGAYLVDGDPADEIALSEWYRHVAVVPQSTRLFRGTVSENIAFFRDLSGPQIVRAAELAHVHDEIEALPQGYDTDIGERGDELSGGQRQRISLARALAGSPSLLFLDEPTSDLDMESESRIQQTLLDLRGSMTTIVVAHRPSTLEACDRILVLESGRLTAVGSPQRVAQTNTYFRTMLSLSSSPGHVRTEAMEACHET